MQHFIHNDTDEAYRQRSDDRIIRNHVMGAVAGGILPIPILDVAAVSAIQYDLVRELSESYRFSLNKHQAKAVVSAVVGTSVAALANSLLKSIPVIGSIAGAISMSALAGASTYALGKALATHYSNGGTLSDLKIKDFRFAYKDLIAEGKAFVSQQASNRSRFTS
jgi:uncharacterized protein (DUF697 family)